LTTPDPDARIARQVEEEFLSAMFALLASGIRTLGITSSKQGITKETVVRIYLSREDQAI